METTNTNISKLAVEEMFEKCDPDKTGKVRVSKVVSFMGPFMEDQLDDLNNLRSMLDPGNIDKEINKDDFSTAVHRWYIEKTSYNENESNINITHLPNLLSPIQENNSILKLDEEACSFRTSSTDKIELQTEIERLAKENQKLLEDNSNIKKLLENSEDANLVLQSEITNLTESFKIERRANVQAKQLRTECQELRETNHNQNKNITKLTNEITLLKNEKRKIEKRKEVLEEENTNLTNSLSQVKNENKNLILLVDKSKLEIEQLNIELNKYCDNDSNQKKIIDEHEKQIEELKDMIQYYKDEKKRLETEQKEIARQQYEYNSSMKDTPSTSSTSKVSTVTSCNTTPTIRHNINRTTSFNTNSPSCTSSTPHTNKLSLLTNIELSNTTYDLHSHHSLDSSMKNATLESSSDDSILLSYSKTASFSERPSLFSELCEASQKSVKNTHNTSVIQQLESEICSLKNEKLDSEKLKEDLEKSNKENNEIRIEMAEINKKYLNCSNINKQLIKIINMNKQELFRLRLNLNSFKNYCLKHNNTFKDICFSKINYIDKMFKIKYEETEHQIMEMQNELKRKCHILTEKQAIVDKAVEENNKLKSKITQLQIELNQEITTSNKLKTDNLNLEEEQKRTTSKLNDIEVNSQKEKNEILNEIKMLQEQKQQIIDCTLDILLNFDQFKELHEAINRRLEHGMGDHEQCGKCFDLQAELLPYNDKCRQFEENLRRLHQLQDNYENFIEENSSVSDINTKQASTRTDRKKSENIVNRKYEKAIRNLEIEIKKNDKLNTQLTKVLNENKSLRTINHEQMIENVKFKDETTKFKHYLEETSRKLSLIFHNILRKLHDDKISVALMNLQNDHDVFEFGKDRYYEPHYVKFNQQLEQCILFLQLIMSDNIFADTLNSSDEVSQSEPCDNSFTQRSKHSEIHLRPASFILPNKSTALSSIAKTNLIPASPDSPSASKIMTETTIVLIHDPPKLNQTYPISSHELNNNVSEENLSNASSISNTNCSTTTMNKDRLMDNSENLVSDNNDVPIISIADATTIIINRNSESNEKLHSCNKSTSASSTNSESTESLNIELEPVSNNIDIHTSTVILENLSQNDEDSPSSHKSRSPETRSRSQSLGEADTTEDIDAFPNIPDSLLEELGLLDDETNEETYEQDEIEQKFTALNLAFTTDMLSLEIRKERIQRHREQAENNLRKEVIRLQQGVHKLNPLCIDAERTQLVTNLLTQIDVLLQAEWHVSTMTQYFGAIMQEIRLSKSVKLMLKYVENLKLQRDTARKHFQCTKRMLQDSNTKAVKVSTQNKKNLNSSPNSPNVNNFNRLITRRRASIATIQRPLTCPPESLRLLNSRRPSPSNVPPINEIFANRRTEFTEQLITSPIRQRRQRIDGGSEHLQNIKENMEIENSDSEESDNSLHDEEKIEEAHLHQIGTGVCNIFRRIVGDNLHFSGVLHEIFSLGALICFSIAIFKIINILLVLSSRNENFLRPSFNTWSEYSTAFYDFFTFIQTFLNL